jgi:hypothetical protein
MRGLFTGGTEGLVEEARKRLGVTGTLTTGWGGRK